MTTTSRTSLNNTEADPAAEYDAAVDRANGLFEPAVDPAAEYDAAVDRANGLFDPAEDPEAE